ncbi:MAG: M42 family metallopeptidase [Thermoplasmata archaeon]
MDIENLIKEMVYEFGVSGYEDPIKEKIVYYLKKYGQPRIDKIGNVYFTFGGNEKHIAFIAHMDEIGVIVTHIDKSGMLRIKRVGGVDSRMLYGQYLEFLGRDGKFRYGVIGLKPPHVSKEDELNKCFSGEELYVDVGARSREEAEGLGFNVLDPGRWMKNFIKLNNRYIVTRGLDDRAGVAILLEFLDRSIKKDLKNKITLIFTVQEETGLRGARGIEDLNYDEIYVIDSVTSADMPNVDYALSPVSLGKGPVFRFFDARGANSLSLVKKLREIAERNGIKYQEVVTGGSTDAAGTFERGIPSLAISFPIKYTHSTVEMLDLNDIENEIKLMEKISEY